MQNEHSCGWMRLGQTGTGFACLNSLARCRKFSLMAWPGATERHVGLFEALEPHKGLLVLAGDLTGSRCPP